MFNNERSDSKIDHKLKRKDRERKYHWPLVRRDWGGADC